MANSGFTTIQLRRDTNTNWTTGTKSLAYGEVGIDVTNGKLRFGQTSGTTVAWASASEVKVSQADSATAATTSTHLAGGASGSLPYQTGSGATTFLAKATNGNSLVLASGVPAWSQLTVSTTYFGTTTSTQLKAVVTDAVGTSDSTAKLVFNYAPTITNPGITGAVIFSGTSGTTTVQAASSASGTLNLPAPTGTENLITSETTATNYVSKTSTDLQSMAASLTLASGKTLTTPNLSASGTVTFGGLSNGILKVASGTVSSGTVDLTPTTGNVGTSTLGVANGGTGGNTVTTARQGLRIFVQSDTPSSPAVGDLWFW